MVRFTARCCFTTASALIRAKPSANRRQCRQEKLSQPTQLCGCQERGRKCTLLPQTLPWTCTDPYGRFYIAFQDNRDGQGTLNGQTLDKWHVRFAAMGTFEKGFGASERVSDDVICLRPPLDFLSCAADKSRAYISWTEASSASGWAFSGQTYIARKILAAPVDGK